MVELTVTFFLPDHPYPFRNNETDSDEVSWERMEERAEGGREGTSYPFAGFYGKTNRRDGSGE
jgi:hypothetical protein